MIIYDILKGVWEVKRLNRVTKVPIDRDDEVFLVVG